MTMIDTIQKAPYEISQSVNQTRFLDLIHSSLCESKKERDWQKVNSILISLENRIERLERKASRK